jgi:Putative Flp pilus-assembly TadE/G-like
MQRSSQRGQTLVLFALASTFLIGIAGLAIEGGLIESERRFDQAISDGAALAGAHHLPSDPTTARQKAVDYAIAGLNGGTIPSLCDPAPLYATDGALPSGCDPSPIHSLTVVTPYSSTSSDILVRLDRRLNLNLAAVVGFSQANVASRSVARSFGGGTLLGYTLFVVNDLTTIGNTDTVVNGNVYVEGCIKYNKLDRLIVSPATAFGQAGNVQVYDKNLQGPQVWDNASGTGCTGNVFANTAGSSQWGCAGHTPSTESSGPAPNFTVPCPGSQTPVPLLRLPQFKVTDTTGPGGTACTSSSAKTFATTGGGAPIASPGCYHACNVSIPDGTSFQSGTYAFVGNGSGGCGDVLFAGSASNDPAATPNGVTFILYNDANLCASKCGTSNAAGTITLSAPSDTTKPNYGVLIFSCNGTCGNGSGNVEFKGPLLTLSLTGLVYNPGGDCTVISNTGLNVYGQLVCNNVDVQGGVVSAGTGVSYGGYSLPIPLYNAELLE